MFREVTQSDLPFLVNSHLKSYRASAPLLSDEVFYREQKRLFLSLINEGRTTIACDAEDPQHILAWAVLSHDGTALHYVYVKHALRGFGLARELVGDARTVTHLTSTGIKVLASHPGRFEFNPYLASPSGDKQ